MGEVVPKPSGAKNQRSIKERDNVEPAAMIRHEEQQRCCYTVVAKCLDYSMPECRGVREAGVHVTGEPKCVEEFHFSWRSIMLSWTRMRIEEEEEHGHLLFDLSVGIKLLER